MNNSKQSRINTNSITASPSTPTIRRRTPRTTRIRTGLLSHAFNNTSQNGEDGILQRIFELLPYQEERTCVDVGAWDGRHLSNTYSLLNEVDDDTNNDDSSKRTKWRGILIEADSTKFKQLQSLYINTDNVCVNTMVSCDPNSSSSLRRVLDNCRCNDGRGWRLENDFDFLCIDVDGIDYWLMYNVLGGDDEQREDNSHEYQQQQQYRPKVICIEFNPTMPTDLIYIQPRLDSIRHGSSLSALVELADSFNYVLVETTVFNAFLVQRELYEEYLHKEVPDTSIEALHEITMGTQLYQLYDGTIKLWGCKKMLWHRLPIDEKKMQMLTSEEREFPFAPGEHGESGEGNSADFEIAEAAIDMSPYFKQNNDSELQQHKKECFTKLKQTLQKDGFALVRGTNVSPTLCNNALRVAKAFLHEADESVRRCCLTKDRARRGYSPMCTENFASLIGEKGPNDLVKKFRIGPDCCGDSEQKALSSLHQANAWPDHEVWDQSAEFRSTIEEYYDQLRAAADSILRAICDGIIAENRSLQESMRVISESSQEDTERKSDPDETAANHTSILTLLGYQSGSRHKKGSKGYLNPLVAAHTDVGMITVLLFDDGKCASLQRSASVEQADQTWMDVGLPSPKYLEGGNDPVFVVNVGDCLSELAGRNLRSTLHRVAPVPSKPKCNERTCLALFVGLESSAQLVLPDGESMSYEEWRRKRIARALDVIKN